LKAEINCSCENDCLSLTSDPEVLAVTVVSKELVVLDLRRPVKSLLSGCAFGLTSVMSSVSDMKAKGFVGSIINGGSSLGALLVIVIAMLSTLSGDCTDLLKWLGNLRE